MFTWLSLGKVQMFLAVCPDPTHLGKLERKSKLTEEVFCSGTTRYWARITPVSLNYCSLLLSKLSFVVLEKM